MRTSIAVLTKNHNLLLELGRHLEGQRPIVPCETVESLRREPVREVQGSTDDGEPGAGGVEVGSGASGAP